MGCEKDSIDCEKDSCGEHMTINKLAKSGCFNSRILNFDLKKSVLLWCLNDFFEIDDIEYSTDKLPDGVRLNVSLTQKCFVLIE